MTGHGGKRQGAGRPRGRKLPARKRHHIGSLCEEAHEAEKARRTKLAIIRSKEYRPDMRAALAKLKRERRRKIPYLKKLPLLIRRREAERYERNLEKLSAEVDRIGGRGKKGTFSRAFSVPTPRPKGQTGTSIRNAIIQRIAMETGQSHEMVRRCWIEYRALRKRR